MEDKEKIQLLKEENIIMSNNYLKENLNKNLYEIYIELRKIINEFSLECKWKFYTDGKVWLCKIFHKKQTICWLSMWKNCLKLSFYFNKKNYKGVFDLKLSEENKDKFLIVDKNQRLIPFMLDIFFMEELSDAKELIRYKKESK